MYSFFKHATSIFITVFNKIINKNTPLVKKEETINLNVTMEILLVYVP